MIKLNNIIYNENIIDYLDNLLTIFIIYLIFSLLGYIPKIVDYFSTLKINIYTAIIILLIFLGSLFVGNLLFSFIYKINKIVIEISNSSEDSNCSSNCSSILKEQLGNYLNSKIKFKHIIYYIFWIVILYLLFYFNIFSKIEFYNIDSLLFWLIIFFILPIKKIKFYENGISIGFLIKRYYPYEKIKIKKTKYFLKITVLNCNYYVLDLNNNLYYLLKINNVNVE